MIRNRIPLVKVVVLYNPVMNPSKTRNYKEKDRSRKFLLLFVGYL